MCGAKTCSSILGNFFFSQKKIKLGNVEWNMVQQSQMVFNKGEWAESNMNLENK